MLKHIYDNLLEKGGSIIIGIDHYLENTQTLQWADDYNLDMLTLSINEWEKMFKINNFKNIDISFFGKKEDWNGTLILYANK